MNMSSSNRFSALICVVALLCARTSPAQDCEGPPCMPEFDQGTPDPDIGVSFTQTQIGQADGEHDCEPCKPCKGTVVITNNGTTPMTVWDSYWTPNQLEEDGAAQRIENTGPIAPGNSTTQELENYCDATSWSSDSAVTISRGTAPNITVEALLILWCECDH